MRKQISRGRLPAKSGAHADRDSSEWRRKFATAKKALGLRIRKLRRQRGWSQEEFAGRCGVHYSWISKIENGKANLRISTMENLAGQFDIGISELLKGVA